MQNHLLFINHLFIINYKTSSLLTDQCYLFVVIQVAQLKGLNILHTSNLAFLAFHVYLCSIVLHCILL